MKLPNHLNAIVPKEKLVDYLLSKTHAIGRFKASYFETIGFSEDNADLLRSELMKIAEFGEIDYCVESSHGVKYIVDGTIETPLGTLVEIRTVWIMENNSLNPRLVTAYPKH